MAPKKGTTKQSRPADTAIDGLEVPEQPIPAAAVGHVVPSGPEASLALDAEVLDQLRRPAEDAPAEAGEVEGFRHQGFEWLDDIACKDLPATEFFAQAGHVLSEDAKRACLDLCEVWRECTIFAYIGNRGQLVTGGYFAALSPGQRKKMSLTEALEHGEKIRANRKAKAQRKGA